MAGNDQKSSDIDESGAQTAADAGAIDVESQGNLDENVEADQGDIELSLEEVIAQLQVDAAEARDAGLRAQADAQNVKRRAEQDVEKARKFALEQFSKELLPIMNNRCRRTRSEPSSPLRSRRPPASYRTTLK